MFHKNVSHKKMARVISNAKIMMLSGGIEYTRTENRIASLDTLLEQEVSPSCTVGVVISILCRIIYERHYT